MLVRLDPLAPDVRVHLPAQPSWAGHCPLWTPFQMWCWWPAVAVSSMAVLDARAHTCLLLAWASCHLGLEGVCSSKPAAISQAPWAGATDRVTGQPNCSPAAETRDRAPSPYSPLCAHISVLRVGGCGPCLWGLGGDVALLRGDAATALPWASQLGHSVSCNDAPSRTQAAELISHLQLFQEDGRIQVSVSQQIYQEGILAICE